MTASNFLMQLGTGGAASSPAGPGQSSVGVQGAFGAVEILRLKVQNTVEKLSFVVQFPSTK